MSTKKTTDQLSWQNIRTNFFIGKAKVDNKIVNVNALQDAIQDGTFDKMVKAAADELHNGDTHAVYAQMSRNLSSWLTNSKKSDGVQKSDRIRYDLLRAYVDDSMKKIRVAGGNADKSYWQWSLEEINAITDYKTAKSVYDNIASYKQKKLDATLQADLYEEYTVRQKAARVKMKELKPVTDPTTAKLMEKLESGEALTQDEAAAVLKLLRK